MQQTNYTINTLPAREALVEKLYKEGHISFKEVLLLMQPEVQIKEVKVPYQPSPLDKIRTPFNPNEPLKNPYSGRKSPMDIFYDGNFGIQVGEHTIGSVQKCQPCYITTSGESPRRYGFDFS